MFARFLRGNFRERDYLEDTGVDVRITLKWILQVCDGNSWAGLIWLRIGTDGGLL
jgi:hypothetical protein